MENPTVSVILPVYNCAEFIGEAIRSAREQTYEDFEVIAVDDGSTDETAEVLEELARSWPKLRWIRAEHRGLAAARNQAIREMRGKWIALLDADDIWFPEKLRRCMDFLQAHPGLSIVYTPMAPVGLDGAPLAGHTKPCRSGWITEALFHSIFVHDPAVVFHKRVIETCGGFEESLPVSVGHEFWLRVSTRFEFGLIDEPLAYRRWHEGSVTRADRARSRSVKARMLERFHDGPGRDLLSPARARRRLASVHYKAGRALLAQGRYPEAAEFLAKASTYQPRSARAWTLGRIARLLDGFHRKGRKGGSGEAPGTR